MIKAVAIDDEPLALKVIEHFCEQTENIVLEKAFTKTEEGIKYLRKFPVDLLFLDIQMPGKNGIDFYKSLSTDVMVIFTTAYSEYAVEGFNLNATDYLLKPISYERFTTAVEKVQKEKSLRMADPENNYFMVRADYKLHKIEYDDILLIEGLDDYIRIHLKDKNTIVTRLSMKGILEKLPPAAFIRVHRSYIVPVSKIKTVQNKTITIEEFVIPIGDTFKNELNKYI